MFIAYGDSGSWIVEKDSGNLFGHIMAGDPSTGLAYIAPAKQIFQAIAHQLDCVVVLPAAGKVASKDLNERTPSIGANRQMEEDTENEKIIVERDNLSTPLPRAWQVEVPPVEPYGLGQRNRTMDSPEIRPDIRQRGSSQIVESLTDSHPILITSNMATGRSWQEAAIERNRMTRSLGSSSLWGSGGPPSNSSSMEPHNGSGYSRSHTGMFAWHFPFPSLNLSYCCFILSYG